MGKVHGGGPVSTIYTYTALSLPPFLLSSAYLPDIRFFSPTPYIEIFTLSAQI
jgi:hypothetical protein